MAATRLQEAIDELRAAAGGRPFALVLDRAHGDAESTSMLLVGPTGQPSYTTLGLLREGMVRIEARVQLSEQPAPRPPPGGLECP